MPIPPAERRGQSVKDIINDGTSRASVEYIMTARRSLKEPFRLAGVQRIASGNLFGSGITTESQFGTTKIEIVLRDRELFANVPKEIQRIADALPIGLRAGEGTITASSTLDYPLYGYEPLLILKMENAEGTGIAFFSNGRVSIAARMGRTLVITNAENIGDDPEYSKTLKELAALYGLPRLGEKKDIPHPFVAERFAQLAEWTAELLKSRPLDWPPAE